MSSPPSIIAVEHLLAQAALLKSVFPLYMETDHPICITVVGLLDEVECELEDLKEEIGEDEQATTDTPVLWPKETD